MKKISILILIVLLLLTGCHKETKKTTKTSTNKNSIVLKTNYKYNTDEEDIVSEILIFNNSKEGTYYKIDNNNEKYEFEFTYTKDKIDINNVGYYKYKLVKDKIYLNDPTNKVEKVFIKE